MADKASDFEKGASEYIKDVISRRIKLREAENRKLDQARVNRLDASTASNQGASIVKTLSRFNGAVVKIILLAVTLLGPSQSAADLLHYLVNSENDTPQSFEIGWATTNITPPSDQIPLFLWGFEGNVGYSVRPEADLYATVMALKSSSDDMQLTIVSVDAVALEAVTIHEIKERIAAEETGNDFDPNSLVMVATHSHTAPFQHALYGGGEQYRKTILVPQISDAIIAAWNNLQNSSLSWKRAEFGEAEGGFCRICTHANGTEELGNFANSLCNANYAVECSRDKFVNLLYAFDDQDDLSGVVVNIGFPLQAEHDAPYISADAAAFMRKSLSDHWGHDVPVVMMIAPGGDQGPHNFGDSEVIPDLVQRRGTEIANIIINSLDLNTIDAKQSSVVLKHVVTDQILTEKDCHGQGNYRYRLHAVRIGDIAFANFPFELYLDYGSSIKAASLADQIFLAQISASTLDKHSGFSPQYLPTPKAVGGGAYGSLCPHGRVGVLGGSQLVAQVLSATNNLFDARVSLDLDGQGAETVAFDSSGNGLDGAVSNPIWTPAKFGNGLSFSGSSSLTVLDAVSPTSYTASLWVKLSSTTDQNIIARTDASPLNYSHQIRVKDGKFEASLWDGARKTVGGSTEIQAGVWYHVAMTAEDRGQLGLYVDGIPEGTPVDVDTMWQGGDRYRIGSSVAGGFGSLYGVVDEVRIYNYAFGGSRILGLFDSPRVHWKLDGTTGDTVALDASGSGLNGTIDGPSWVPAKLNNGLSLNGSSSVTVLDGEDPIEYSASLWVKLSSTADQNIIARTDASTLNYSHQIRVGNGKFEAYMWDGTQKTVRGWTEVQTGVWYHVAMTAGDQDQLRLYVNGISEGEAADLGIIWQGGDRYRVGSGVADGFGSLQGIVDEIQIYDYVPSYTRLLRFVDDAPTTGSARVDLKLDGEGADTVAVDSSGNGLDGVVSNSSWVSGKSNNGLSLNGSSSVIVLDDKDPREYSVSLWVKPLSTADQNIIARTGPSPLNYSHQLRVSDGKFESYVWDGAQKVVRGWTNVQACVWYHVAMTAGNHGQLKLFVNGISEGDPIGIGTMWQEGDRYSIGSGVADGFGSLTGVVDEIQLYDYELGQYEVLGLYRDDASGEEPTRVYLKLDGEGSAGVAVDSSGNGLNGSIYNPFWISAKLNNGLSFNGSSSVTVLDSDDPIEYSASLWIKLSSTADQNIIARTDGSPLSYSHQLRVRDGKFESYVWDGAQKVVRGWTEIQIDEWYHVAMTAGNQGLLRLYINGVSEGEPIAVGTMWDGGDRYWIGSGVADGFGWLNGVVDEVKIYDHSGAACQ